MTDLRVDNLPTLMQYENQIDVVNAIKKILYDACVVYFGISVDRISDELVKVVTKDILIKCKLLTLEDVKYSFERISIIKAFTISYDDLFKPVMKFYAIKHRIDIEITNIRREEEAKKSAEFKEVIFEKESATIYKRCLSAGLWDGSIFNAFIVAKKHLSDKFSQEEKQRFLAEAKAKRKKLDALEENNLDSLFSNQGYTIERLYGEIMVIEAISRKINFNV